MESLNWKLKKQTLRDLIILSQRYDVRSEMTKYLKIQNFYKTFCKLSFKFKKRQLQLL